MVQTDAALMQLIESVRAFNARFQLADYQDAGSVARNVHEEAGEVVLALTWGHRDDVVQELADLLFVTLQGCFALGVTDADLARAMVSVAEKNNLKTHATHRVEGGKVRRLPSL